MQELLHQGEKAQKKLKKLMIQTVTSLFSLERNLSHDCPHRSRSKVTSASQ